MLLKSECVIDLVETTPVGTNSLADWWRLLGKLDEFRTCADGGLGSTFASLDAESLVLGTDEVVSLGVGADEEESATLASVDTVVQREARVGVDALDLSGLIDWRRLLRKSGWLVRLRDPDGSRGSGSLRNNCWELLGLVVRLLRKQDWVLSSEI